MFISLVTCGLIGEAFHTSTKDVFQRLKSMSTTHIIPEVLDTDNNLQFSSSVFYFPGLSTCEQSCHAIITAILIFN